MADDPALTNPTPSGTNPPSTGGSDKPKEPTTKEYTIQSVNTGLVGDHVRENVEVDGKPYGVGDKVSLSEVAHTSLKAAGVKFKGDTNDEEVK